MRDSQFPQIRVELRTSLDALPDCMCMQYSQMRSLLMMISGSILHSYTALGDKCNISINSFIDHECQIDNGVHQMGGSVITG